MKGKATLHQIKCRIERPIIIKSLVKRAVSGMYEDGKT